MVDSETSRVLVGHWESRSVLPIHSSHFTKALVALTLLCAEPTPGQEAKGTGDLPSTFQPLAPLIGTWKGQVAPTADRLRGWVETHEWAWAFENEQPVGMSVRFSNSRFFQEGRLSFDSTTERFRLAVKDPSGRTRSYAGAFDPKTRALVLDELEAGPEGPGRLTIRPNSNKIRYVLWFDRKAPGSPTHTRVLEGNLGRDGVRMAGGQNQVEECVVTGGTATLTVSYKGKTYPLCCSGCREQFLENPERYIAKSIQRAQGQSSRRSTEAIDDFDLGGSPPSSNARNSGDTPDRTERKSAEGSEPGPISRPTKDQTHKASESIKKTESSPSQAATWLRLGQSLERQGKKEAAVNYYRRILKDQPSAPEAAAARARIESLGGKP